MNHFSNKTKPARNAINEMRVILQRFKGDSTDQSKRIDILEDLVNYTIAKEIELNEVENTNAKLLMVIGEIQAKLKDMNERYYISEKIHEASVDDVVNEFYKKFECQLTK